MTYTKRQTVFLEKYQALVRYTATTGSALVPADHVEGDIKLGAWVSYLRTRYHNNKLSSGEIELFEELPGWQWGPLRPGPKSDKERDAAIRQMRSDKMSLAQIGEQYGLSRQRIHQIVTS